MLVPRNLPSLILEIDGKYKTVDPNDCRAEDKVKKCIENKGRIITFIDIFIHINNELVVKPMTCFFVLVAAVAATVMGIRKLFLEKREDQDSSIAAV